MTDDKVTVDDQIREYMGSAKRKLDIDAERKKQIPTPYIKEGDRGIVFSLISTKQWSRANHFFQANGIRATIIVDSNQKFLFIKTEELPPQFKQRQERERIVMEPRQQGKLAAQQDLIREQKDRVEVISLSPNQSGLAIETAKDPLGQIRTEEEIDAITEAARLRNAQRDEVNKKRTKSVNHTAIPSGLEKARAAKAAKKTTKKKKVTKKKKAT